MKKKLKVLALFDAIAPTTIDQDLSKEIEDRGLENRGKRPGRARHSSATPPNTSPSSMISICCGKNCKPSSRTSFSIWPTSSKTTAAFDQNIVSFLEMQGVPFTGCGSTGLTLCKHKGISKKILQLSSHSRAGFRRHPARQTHRPPEATQVSHSGEAAKRRSLATAFRRPRLSRQTSNSRNASRLSTRSTTTTSSRRNTSRAANFT